jgi:hypothetical protein
MKIDYNDIVSKAMATFVAAVIIGAGALVWREAMSVESRVHEATRALEEQAAYLQKTVEVVEKELVDEKNGRQLAEKEINRLIEELKNNYSNDLSIPADSPINQPAEEVFEIPDFPIGTNGIPEESLTQEVSKEKEVEETPSDFIQKQLPPAPAVKTSKY